MKKTRRNKMFFKRFCKKCGKLFRPTSKFNCICDKCLKSRYKNAGVKKL